MCVVWPRVTVWTVPLVPGWRKVGLGGPGGGGGEEDEEGVENSSQKFRS
jgi:hypothetical protein